jgi:hypothetical protein
MLKHDVVTRIGDKTAGTQLIRARPVAPLSSVASVARVEQIGIRGGKLRKQ